MSDLAVQLAKVLSDPRRLADFQPVARDLHDLFEAMLVDECRKRPEDRGDALAILSECVHWTNDLMNSRVVPTSTDGPRGLPSERIKRRQENQP